MTPTPRLYSCYFDVPSGVAWPASWYERHARVLEHSAKLNTPGWSVDVRKIAPAMPRASARGGNKSSYSYNTHKLIDWNTVVQESPDGALLLVCDADLMVLAPLDPVWQGDFDVAFTSKRGLTRIPINAGVVFVRVNARARAWFAAWLEWNLRLLGDKALHDRYWKTYAGMNQAALGALIENEGPKLAQQLELACTEWNCESATWETFNPAKPARIVHVKGAMRRSLMNPAQNGLTTQARRRLAEIWWSFEREAAAKCKS